MNSFPHKIQKSVAGFLVTLVVTLTTYGTPYYGTITETITYTNDSSFHVGQTFIGSYQYDAPTVDGIFGQPDRQHDDAINTLSGLLFNWNPHLTDCVGQDRIGGPTSLLTVSGDTVTGFNYDGENSFGQFWFTASTFAWAGYFPMQTGIFTSGTLCFSAPTAQAVPEFTTTVSMVVLSFLGLSLIRRRFVR